MSPDESTDRSAQAARKVIDDTLVVVVLAAGLGTRMRSALPKPLHPVAGRPMVEHVLRAADAARPSRTVLVVAPGLDDLAARLGLGPDVVTTVQDPPRGTGDALRRGLEAAGEADRLIALFADHPLVTTATVRALVEGARTSGAWVTVLTCTLPEAGAYGRVDFVDGQPVRIVEAKDDDPVARRGPVEINSGMMVFDVPWLRTALPRLTPSPVTGELYMTDLVGLAVADGPRPDDRWPVATIRADPEVAQGINDRVQLAAADAVLRERIRRDLMRAGVTLVGPETIFVDADVEIGPDTTILPFTVIGAGTRIGANCVIGPHAHLIEARLGDGVAVRAATIVRSTVRATADVGPYAHVRGGSDIGPGAHVGTSVELKATTLGEGTRVGHFSYIGDATVGAGVNIGAGAITANYDGTAKHATTIGAGAFIGSDTILVAPVEIGVGARTGAGAVVTKNVPAGATVVGVPARPVGRRGPEGDERVSDRSPVSPASPSEKG